MGLKVAGNAHTVASPKSTYGDHLGEHLESKPILAAVSVEKKTKGVLAGAGLSESETVIPGLFDSNGMKITVEGSHTVNLGNYESAKIGVSLTVPCSPSSLNEAYEWALGWCGERIQSEVNAAKGQ